MEDEWEWAIALYDDIRGLVSDAAIEALVAWLPTRTGVDDAVHEDREVILVAGPIDRHTLAVTVVARLAGTGDPDHWTERPDGTVTGPGQP